MFKLDPHFSSKTVVVLGVVLFLVFQLGLVGNAEETELVVAIPVGSETLSPLLEKNSTVPTHDQFFAHLVRADFKRKGEVVRRVYEPALAKEWEYIPNEPEEGKSTWIFKLREGLKFSNGEPLTAEDVKFSWDRIQELGPERTTFMNKGFQWIDKVQAPDELTVQVIMSKLRPHFLPDVTINPSVIPKDYFQKVGEDEFARKPVGSGAFKVVSWSQNEQLVLEANEFYWKGRPEIDKLVFRVIPDIQTRVAELIAGDVDLLLEAPPHRIKDIKSKSNLSVSSVPSPNNLYVGMNTHNEPFDKLLVRKAVAHAINVEDIVEAIFQGHATKSSAHCHKVCYGHNPGIEPYSYDPDQAKKLLDEAGYPNGFETEVAVAPLGLWPKNVEVFRAVSGYLRQIGIDVNFKKMEWANYFKDYLDGNLNGIFMWGHSSTAIDCDSHFRLNYRSVSEGGRGIYWSNSEVDELIQKEQKIPNRPEREQILQEIQVILHKKIPTVRLFEYDKTYAYNNKFEISPRPEKFYADTVKLSDEG